MGTYILTITFFALNVNAGNVKGRASARTVANCLLYINRVLPIGLALEDRICSAVSKKRSFSCIEWNGTVFLQEAGRGGTGNMIEFAER